MSGVVGLDRRLKEVSSGRSGCKPSADECISVCRQCCQLDPDARTESSSNRVFTVPSTRVLGITSRTDQ